MKKRWITGELPEKGAVEKLASSINVSRPMATLLVQRGIHDLEDARVFFRPDLGMLHDPLLMKDMDKAVDRLELALQTEEHILIYGDYDVDGTTSVALVVGFLSQHTGKVSFYINDRETEGYGISDTGVDYAAEMGVSLIISLDCGIKAVDKVRRATEKGIDFIICDHHTTGDSLPGAVAVLDPKREDCTYPYKELSGCGVGFKLMQAIAGKMEWDETPLLDKLDLVAVSIAADIVPITGENRILCYHGMKKLQRSPSPGLGALLEISGSGDLNIQKVVFGLAPRINAAGRMAHAREAVQLLLSEDLGKARNSAEKVNNNNKERRSHDISITEEALKMISEGGNRKSTVLYAENWHLGVLGIVASRCIEQYHRPTIILTRADNKATGSARSVPGYNIYQAILECEDLLLRFGGHAHAAGLTLALDKVEAFRSRFEQVVETTISEELLVPVLEIDMEVHFDELTDNFLSVLSQMEPFGPGNMTPVFSARNLYVWQGVSLLKEKHLKFMVRQEGSQSVFEAIGFNMGEYQDELELGKKFRLAFCPEYNEYMSERRIQLRIKDIQFE